VKALLLIAAIVLAFACGPQKPNPSPPPYGGQGGYIATGGAGFGGDEPFAGAGGIGPTTPCLAAQYTLERLGCEQARSPSGTPFGEACERAEGDGREWHPECIALVQHCSEVDAAYRGEICR